MAFESQFKGHKGNLINQQMIFSDFHCRGTLNQKPTIELIFLSCKVSGRSMAVKWVVMTKKKMKTKTRFKKKLIIVCGRRQLDQQATAQTALKLSVVYNTNTKIFTPAIWRVNLFVSLRFCHVDFKIWHKIFENCETVSSCKWLTVTITVVVAFFGWACPLCLLGLATHYRESWLTEEPKQEFIIYLGTHYELLAKVT